MSHIRRHLIIILLLLIGLCQCQVPDFPTTIPTPNPTETIPVVYPDYSRRILFSSAGDLHIMHANGAGRQNLTPDTPSQETMPAWSPDGKYIAFVSDREENEDVYIVSASAPGDEHLQINVSQHPAQDHSPAWDTTGLRLAFASNRDVNWSICVLDIAMATSEQEAPIMAGPMRYTHNTLYDGHPSWSSTGIIAFSRNEGYRWRIYQIDTNGATANIVPGTEGLSGALHPHWSPDGTKIAFSGVLNDNWDIYMINLLTNELRQLTTHPDRDWWPRWSPDGQYIVFTSERSGNGDIYLVHPESWEEYRLTDNPEADLFPTWEP